MSDKDKDLTTGDIRDGLANALKEKLTKFEKDLEGLSKKEALAKAQEANTLKKVTPPGVSEALMHKLKQEYGGDKEKAYATAWKIHGEQKAKRLKKNATEGYGASSAMSGAGTPGLQQTGVGMNKNAMCDYSKAEACSKCGKTHKETMGKCSTDEIKPEVPMTKEEMGKGLRDALLGTYGQVGKKPKPGLLFGTLGTPGLASSSGQRQKRMDVQSGGATPTKPTSDTDAMGKPKKAPHISTINTKPDTTKAEGIAGYPLKGQSKKSEDYINRKDSANPKARTKTIGKEGTLPGTKASKKVEAEGSGGQIKENKGLKKSEGLAKQMSTEGPVTVSTKGKTPAIPGKGRSPAGIRGATPKIPGRSPAGIRGAVPSLKPHQSTMTSLKDIRAIGDAKAALGAAPTLPAVQPSSMPPQPAYQRKIGADEILAARAAAKPTPTAMPAQAAQTTMKIPGRPAANQLADDKAAGGVGFLNSLIAKFKGVGNQNWDAPSAGGGQRGVAAGSRALLRRSEMTKADKPEVGRKPTVSEKAFGNKTAMTAPESAPHPGEPAKSMYKAEVANPYKTHMNWLLDNADPENPDDRLAYHTVKYALSGGSLSAHASAHTMNWLRAKADDAVSVNPLSHNAAKELHGVVSRLGGVKAPPAAGADPALTAEGAPPKMKPLVPENVGPPPQPKVK